MAEKTEKSVVCKGINIHKTYWRGKIEVHALQGVDIEIRRNEYISIMGASGSGKSTLIHILGCLDTPTRGEYYLEEKRVSEFSDDELARIRNQSIGFVFQEFNLLPRLSALENVALPLVYAGKKRIERIKKSRAILEKLGLGERIHHRPNELSGGECQRVAIARALINEPKIIFADEPTGNLDSKTGQEIMAIFDKLVEEGNTLVMVTHDPDIARSARRIIKLKDGRIGDA